MGRLRSSPVGQGTMQKRLAIIVRFGVALAIGVLLSLSLRVYPEQVAERGTWLGPGQTELPDWSIRSGWCSAADIARQGFIYDPVVMGARVIHCRKPKWLYAYPLLVLVCASLAYLLLVLTGWALRRLRGAPAFFAMSRVRQWALLYGMLSVLSLGVHLYHVWRGGLSACSYLFGLYFQFVNETLIFLTFPCQVLNGLILHSFGHLNRLLYGWTSPRLGASVAARHPGFFGFYPSAGVWFDCCCLVVLIAFWGVALQPVLSWIERWRASRRQSSPAS